jgi:ADP-ribose pyrophosphatase YjhB (NUDIX family)
MPRAITQRGFIFLHCREDLQEAYPLVYMPACIHARLTEDMTPCVPDSGTLSFPGGHLEFGESIFSCVERETLEESGLVVRGVRTVGVTNDFFVENNLHYITVWAICERVDEEQEPQVRAVSVSYHFMLPFLSSALGFFGESRIPKTGNCISKM